MLQKMSILDKTATRGTRVHFARSTADTQQESLMTSRNGQIISSDCKDHPSLTLGIKHCARKPPTQRRQPFRPVSFKTNTDLAWRASRRLLAAQEQDFLNNTFTRASLQDSDLPNTDPEAVLTERRLEPLSSKSVSQVRCAEVPLRVKGGEIMLRSRVQLQWENQSHYNTTYEEEFPPITMKKPQTTI